MLSKPHAVKIFHNTKKFFILFFIFYSPCHSALSATDIPFTINLSEAVNITGTPQIPIDVGGTTRYANYTSGTGTSALTFNYSATAGDLDLDGITLTSPISLNGGTIKDLNGNDATLTFTPPNTSNIKINYPSLSLDFVDNADGNHDGRYSLNGTIHDDLASLLSSSGGAYARSGNATYYNSSGTLSTASPGTIRFDHDPTTHAPKGILMEEGRINIARWSKNLENAYWGAHQSTGLADVTLSPDGTTTADKVADLNAFATDKAYLTRSISVSSSSDYTVSMYVKAADYNYIEFQLVDPSDLTPNAYPIFNMTTGAIVSSNGATNIFSQQLDNGWFRIGYTYTTDAAQTTIQLTYGGRPVGNNSNYSGVVNNGIYVWGIQLEKGSFATSYIPTASSTGTRSADNLTLPTAGWYSGTEQTLYSESSILNGNNNNYKIIAEGYPANAGITHSYQETGTAYELDAREFTGTNAMMGSTALNAIGAVNKFGLTGDSSGTSFAVNGTALSPNHSPPTNSGPTDLAIGSRGVNSLYLNGWIKKIKFYPNRINNTQLQLLTQ